MFDRLKRDSKTAPQGDDLEYLKDVEAAYSVPYQWGSLTVSRQADQAYGLVNLDPSMVLGRLDQVPRGDIDLGIPGIELWLLGPAEMDPNGESPGLLGVDSASSLSKDSIRIAVSLGDDIEGIHGLMASDRAGDLFEPESVKEIHKIIESGDDAEVKKVIRNTLVTTLSMTFSEIAKDDASAWLWEKLTHLDVLTYDYHRENGLLGAAALVLAGKALRRTDLGAAAAGTFLFFSSKNARKQYVERAESRQEMAELIAENTNIVSSWVNRDIFLTFCPDDQSAPAKLYDQESGSEEE